MPTISIFYGIVIQMYWRDHNPPHLHAFYQGHEALFAIETGEILAGSLPKRAEVMVRDWVADNRRALGSNWERARVHEALEQIPGADVQ